MTQKTEEKTPTKKVKKTAALYTKEAGSKIAFTLELDEAATTKAFDMLVQRYRKNISIKGFRKGKAPIPNVIASVGIDTLSMEAFERALDDTYRKFLIEHKIFPVGQPEVDVKSFEEKPVKVAIAVEVQPEVELGDYKKIKVKPIKVEIKDKDINDVIETIMVDMKLGKEVKRAAKNNDLIKADFVAKDEKGEVIPRTEGKDMEFRLGVGHYLPDLEAGYVGMKAGEEKKVPVAFPADYQSPDMAGKTIQFEIKVHEVKSVSHKDLDETAVEKIMGEKKTIAEFKEQVKSMISGNKTNTEKKKAIESYKADLIKKVKIDLPASWIKSEVDDRLDKLKKSPSYQASPDKFWKNLGKTEEKMTQEFEDKAKTGLTEYLALVEIVKIEEIELDKEEAEAVHTRVHRQLGDDQDHSSDRHGRLMGQYTVDAKIDKFLNALFL
jgi:trigger factor